MTVVPKTGEILTMSGSRSFNGENIGCNQNVQNCKYNPEVNVLTTLQSPGSKNKPLGYYIAFSKGILAPGSFLPDIPITFDTYVPRNWDGKFRGTYNTYAERMLRESRNIPALIVMSLIGVEEYINTARDFGYSTYESFDKYGISLILGGGDIYPIEHLQAYSIFANGGELIRFEPILRIEDQDGNIIYNANPIAESVADPAATYLLNKSLQNLETGAGDVISWDDREISGKTGTTQDNKDSFLIIYSPDFVALGWAGNNNNEPMNSLYGWPAFTFGPWLKRYMSELNSSSTYFTNKTPFPKPENVYFGGGVNDCDSSGKCRGLKENWLIKGNEPPLGDVIKKYSTNEETGETSSSFTYTLPNEKLQKALWDYFAGR